MSTTLLIIICIACVLLLLIFGSPIYLCLGTAGILGIYLNGGLAGLNLLQTTVFGSVSKFTLVAAPLFILMGEIISRSGIGADLYNAFARMLRRLPGGLAVATVVASAIFGAMCGVSIAAVAAIGGMALPEMLKRGYDPRLAAGSVCAPGALAMLIPPSLLFILYGEVAHVSVAKLFTAGILPGLLLASLMCGYIMIRVMVSPKTIQPKDKDLKTDQEPTILLIKRLWAPVLLIIIVLGSIYLGIATPTESAAIGVIGAYFVSIIIYRSLGWKGFLATLEHSARVTTMILLVVVGAIIFTQFLNLVRLPDMFANMIVSFNLSPIMTLIIIQLMLLSLGMFVDGASMILITTPILLPTIVAMNWDPIWFGVLMIANIEMAVITPPVGLNLYTLAGITDDVDIETILKGTLPYVLVEAVGVLILMIFPQISLWLPSLMK